MIRLDNDQIVAACGAIDNKLNRPTFIIAPRTSHTPRDRTEEVRVVDRDDSVTATVMVIFTHVTNFDNSNLKRLIYD